MDLDLVRPWWEDCVSRVDDRGRPSACEGWTVGDVLDHVDQVLGLMQSLLVEDLRAVLSTPVGRMTGRELVDHVAIDLLAHGWDLDPVVPPLAEEVWLEGLRTAEAVVPPEHRGAMVGPIVAVPADAPAMERFLGFLGRDPLPAGRTA